MVNECIDRTSRESIPAAPFTEIQYLHAQTLREMSLCAHLWLPIQVVDLSIQRNTKKR